MNSTETEKENHTITTREETWREIQISSSTIREGGTVSGVV